MSIDYQGNGGGVPRKTAKIFASNADSQDVTVFGSTLAEDTTYTTDIAEIQNSAFETGWRDAIISNLNYPLLADMNGVQKTLSQQIAYLLQHGIPAYDSGTTYYAYDKVLYNDIIYTALQDNFSNHAPSDTSYWAEYYNPNKGALRNIGEIVSSAIPLTDAGLHLLDGSLINGSGIYAEFVNYIGDLFESSPKNPNLIVYGSPTINNGVVSGFSASSFARLPQVFNPSSNAWEMLFKITTGNDVSNTQVVLGDLDRSIDNLAIWINSSNFNLYIGTNTAGTYTVLANTTYYIKVVYNGTSYTLSYSLDGETFTTDITVTTTAIPATNLAIGNDYDSNYFGGSINLNESYIDIDGSRWWTGMLPSWCCDENQWQTTNTTYGSCGKFVYTSAVGDVPATVRLPKVTNILEGTTDLTALGDLVASGLPQHTHTRGTMEIYGATGSIGMAPTEEWNGAIHRWHSGVGCAGLGDLNGLRFGSFDFYASRNWTGSTSDANYTYTTSATTKVQPQTVKCLYYIVIASLTKTEIEVDIDEIATDLNGKADTDLTNTTAVGKALMANSAMPSATKTALVIGASGSTYTAPADGYFNINCEMYGANTYIWLQIGSYKVFQWCDNSSQEAGLSIPAKKGDVCYLYHNCNPYLESWNTGFNFYYAQGEV